MFDPPEHITCTPVSPPIDIPAGGGSYVWDISVTNNGATSKTFDIWINIAGPDVSDTKGPIPRMLAAIASLSHPLTMNVPDFAPADAYTHTCNVGDFVTTTIDDRDNFAWTKSPPDGFLPDVVLAWSADAEIEAQLEGRANATIDIPGMHVLEAAYPNPFNPSVTVPFSIPEAAHVEIELYDVLGRKVAVLANSLFNTGRHTLRFDGSGMASGVYVLRAVIEPEADVAVQAFTQRLTLLK